MMLEWRIYYANGITVDNTQSSWDDAPIDGVICVVVKDKELGRLVYNKQDFYTQIPGGTEQDVSAVNDIGPYLRAYVKAIKVGLWTPKQRYKDILSKATHDPDFPKVK